MKIPLVISANWKKLTDGMDSPPSLDQEESDDANLDPRSERAELHNANGRIVMLCVAVVLVVQVIIELSR